MPKYAVFGPREGRTKGQVYNDLENVSLWMNTLKDVDLVIAGGGKGIEQLAEQWAVAAKKKFQLIAPEFDPSQPGAIPFQIAFNNRNMKILRECDIVVVFWDGRFKDMIEIMQTAIAHGKKVLLYPM